MPATNTTPSTTPTGGTTSNATDITSTTGNTTTTPNTTPNTSTNTTGTTSNRSNTNRRNRTNNNTTTNTTLNQPKFKGKIEELAVLGTRLERGNKADQFIIFRQSIKHHIGTTFNNPADLDPVIVDLTNPVKHLMTQVPKEITLIKELGYDKADDVPADMTSTIASMLAEEMKQFVQRKNKMKDNLNKLYEIVWGQCSPGLQADIKGSDDYTSKERNRDIVWLLQALKKTASGVDRKANTYFSLHKCIKSFYTLRQGNSETVEAYLQRFDSITQTIHMEGGNITDHDGLTAFERKHGHVIDTDKLVKDKFLAMAFLMGADPGRYKTLWHQLQNSMLVGRDEYPKNITNAYDLLCQYKNTSTTGPTPTPSPSPSPRSNTRNQNGVNVTFAQVTPPKTPAPTPPPTDIPSDPVPGNNGLLFPHTLCFLCNRKGHSGYYCPNKSKSTGVQSMQLGTTFAQLTTDDPPDSLVNNDWLLLDSGSTVSSIRNSNLLSDIHDITDPMRVYTNGGCQDYVKKGLLNILPFEVYYNAHSLANILSLAEVAKHFRVTMDSESDPSILVHVSNDSTLRFSRCSSG